MYRLLPSLTLALFVSSPLVHPEIPSRVDHAQKPCEIWGQVAGSARLLQQSLNIELAGPDGVVKQKIHVLKNGNFAFKPVPVGNYQFRVTNPSGVVILEKAKFLSVRNDLVFLIVPDPNWEQAASNTVSLTALQHKIPHSAWDAFRAAQKSVAAGDTEASMRHLQEALLIDPDFSNAHSDLAAIYGQTGRVEEALQHADTAFNLNPQLPEAGCNLVSCHRNM